MHPENTVLRQNTNRRYRYNFGTIDYNKYMIAQQGKCAICTESGKELVIDHDHITMAVRQLLCDDCNKGFGILAENISFMQNAIDYLIRNGHI